jgi:hypothetical protein
MNARIGGTRRPKHERRVSMTCHPEPAQTARDHAQGAGLPEALGVIKGPARGPSARFASLGMTRHPRNFLPVCASLNPQLSTLNLSK